MSSVSDTSDNATLKRSFTYEDGKEKDSQATQEDQNQGDKKCDNLEKKTETAEEVLASAKIELQTIETATVEINNNIADISEDLADYKEEQEKEETTEDRQKELKELINKTNKDLKQAKKDLRSQKGLKAKAELKVTKASALAKKKKNKKERPTSFLEFPHLTEETEAPKCTKENLIALLDHLGYEIKYNETLRAVDFFEAGENALDAFSSDAVLAELKSQAVQYGLSKMAITDYIGRVAEENKYNPIAEWITSKTWDKKPRFNDFLNTVQTTNNSLRDLYITKWMLASVAAIFQKNFWCKCVLVFQGEQSLAKTSWFKKLLPDDMYKYLTEGFRLDTDNKDSIQQASSTWLIELGELDQTLEKHPAKLKAYFTKQVDKFRPPYGKTPIDFKRRSVFFASVNPAEFLKDNTGNSRYWCLALTELEHMHDLDMQQVFAEVYYFYLKGQIWWLDKEEEKLVDESNRQFMLVQPIEEQILEVFDISLPRTRWYTATQVLRKIGYDKPTNGQTQKAGNFLKTTFESKRDRAKGIVYSMPKNQPVDFSW